jgi:putative ABC transport system substrate-binding protein
MTGRRQFITLLGGAAAWPLASRAQQSVHLVRIGILMSGAEGDKETQARVDAIRQGLSAFGWSEGRNIRIDYRYAAASTEQARVLAGELVALKPDLIVGTATQMAKALQQETSAIPIVFVGINDPIGSGLVVSLARPGGNITGTLLNEESVVGKWLAMLREIAPKLERVAVLLDDKNTFFQSAYAPHAEAAARSLAIRIVLSPFASEADIERTLAAFARDPNGGVLVPPDIQAVLHRDLIIRLAAQYRLPAVYQARFWVAAGGLMSYGADRIAAHRQAAYYVDRILRGAAPAQLPVQAPTKYETAINLKTAKALGLIMPPGLLIAADEVIE